MSTHRRGQHYIGALSAVSSSSRTKNAGFDSSLDSRSLENYHWKLVALYYTGLHSTRMVNNNKMLIRFYSHGNWNPYSDLDIKLLERVWCTVKNSNQLLLRKSNTRATTTHVMNLSMPYIHNSLVHFGGSVLKLDSREHSVLALKRSIDVKERSVLYNPSTALGVLLRHALKNWKLSAKLIFSSDFWYILHRKQYKDNICCVLPNSFLIKLCKVMHLLNVMLGKHFKQTEGQQETWKVVECSTGKQVNW